MTHEIRKITGTPMPRCLFLESLHECIGIALIVMLMWVLNQAWYCQLFFSWSFKEDEEINDRQTGIIHPNLEKWQKFSQMGQ